MPVVITQSLIAKAQKEAEATRTRTSFTDARARGLELRVGPNATIWCFRFKATDKYERLEIGAYPLWSIEEARRLANDAGAQIQTGAGLPTRKWMAQMRARYGKGGEFVEETYPVTLTGRRAWTFAQGREKYLEHVFETLKPHTFRDYRERLSCAALERVADEPLPRLRPSDFAAILRRIRDDVSQDRAEKICVTIRTMFKWLAETEERAEDSGVDYGVMERLKPPQRRRPDENAPRKKMYVPALFELGRVLVIARSGAFDEDEALAVEMVVQTVQRRLPIAGALIEDFTDGPEGCGVWSIRAVHRKTAARMEDNTDHIVVLVPALWKRVQAQIERVLEAARKDTEERKTRKVDRSPKPDKFLFPASRPRIKNEDIEHRDESFITHCFSWMPVEDQLTPHKTRRSFASLAEDDIGITLRQAKLVLDHAEGVPLQDTTKRFYNSNRNVREKVEIMTRWSAMLEDAAKSALVQDPLLGDRDKLAAVIEARRIAARSDSGESQTA